MLLKKALPRSFAGFWDFIRTSFKAIGHLFYYLFYFGYTRKAEDENQGPNMKAKEIFLAICLFSVVIIPGIFAGWFMIWKIGAYCWGRPLWWWMTLGAVLLKPTSEVDETWRDDRNNSACAHGCAASAASMEQTSIMGMNLYELTKIAVEAVQSMMVGFALPDVVVACLFPSLNTYAWFDEKKKLA